MCIANKSQHRTEGLLISSIVFSILISVVLTSCEPEIRYYRMEDFTDEQSARIKNAFDLTDQVHMSLISLTQDVVARDSSVVLVFTLERNEREKFNEDFPAELRYIENYQYQEKVDFNGSIYHLTREATGGRNSTLKEYLPLEDNETVLYVYKNFSYGLDIQGLAKEYGKEVPAFPYDAKLI